MTLEPELTREQCMANYVGWRFKNPPPHRTAFEAEWRFRLHREDIPAGVCEVEPVFAVKMVDALLAEVFRLEAEVNKWFDQRIEKTLELKRVEAAIEALREPTPEIEAAWKAIDPVRFDWGTFHKAHAAVIAHLDKRIAPPASTSETSGAK